MTPRVTVLMPVYNGERYLREAVDGILAQTFSDFEFLIINDGSTDGSRSILESYRDPRIRLIHNATRLGLTRTLNRGLSAVRSEFVARQDADDVSEPDRLACEVAHLDSHPAVALVGCSYKKIGAAGEFLGDRPLPIDCLALRWALLYFNRFIHGAVLFRREWAPGATGLFNEDFEYAQDYDLWSRIARRAPVANLPEYLVRYRHSPHSMSSALTDKQAGEHFCVVANNLREVLGREEWKRQCIYENQHKVMKALLFGSPGEFSSEEAARLLPAIHKLHAAFCHYYRIGAPEAALHRKQLDAGITARLMDLALTCMDREKFAEARRWLRLVMHVDPTALASVPNARLLLKLLMGPTLTRAARGLLRGVRR